MNGGENEIFSIPSTPITPQHVVSAPPSQVHSPSHSWPSLQSPEIFKKASQKHRNFSLPASTTPQRATATTGRCQEDISHLIEVDYIDAWLPITESRNGNAYYAAFHTICAGVGVQTLLLPIAFVHLGWVWGTLWLGSVFIWQLYTLWVLTELHESVAGARYSRYLHLSIAAYGEKLGKWMVMFPIMYLSGGTCTVLIIIGGGGMKLFSDIICGSDCISKVPTTAEWYLVFVFLAVIVAQLPNLNSIAGISLLGAIMAISYCTTIWIVSISNNRPAGISYKPITTSMTDSIFGITNGLGIIAFVFRGHNLTLEIQGTMPSSIKHPSRVPMWKGIKMAYVLVAACLFPIAFGGYWAYGNLISTSGMLIAMYKFHLEGTSKAILGTTILFVVISCLSSFQIYAMVIFDDMEYGYVKRQNKPCPQWLRAAFRAFFGLFSLFIAAAFPFLSHLAGLLGAVSLPVTLAYPCLMWILMKKPERYSWMWFINWVLGCLGMALSMLLLIGGVWSLSKTGLKLRFFKLQ